MHIVLWCEGPGRKGALFQPLLMASQSEKICVVGCWEHLPLGLGSLGAGTWAQGSPLTLPRAVGCEFETPHHRGGIGLPEWVLQLAWLSASPSQTPYGDIQPHNATLHQWTRPQPSGPSWKTEARTFSCCTGMLRGQRSPLQTDCNVLR